MSRTKWCEVIVFKHGRMDWPLENAIVSGVVSGCGLHTPDVRTDRSGKATITWASGGHLEKIYVKGGLFEPTVSYQGPFEEGETRKLNY